MTVKQIVITTLLVAAILFSLFKIYSLFYRPTTHKLSADLQWLGVIDLDDAPKVTPNSIMNGEEVVLVIDHASVLYQAIIQKIPQAKLLTPEEVFNLNNLHLLDDNADGLISAKDDIFKHLFIIKYYDKGHQNDIESLPAAGIKAIHINNTTPTGDHLVLMSDGSQRTLIGTDRLEQND